MELPSLVYYSKLCEMLMQTMDSDDKDGPECRSNAERGDERGDVGTKYPSEQNETGRWKEAQSKQAFIRFTTDEDIWPRNTKAGGATTPMESAFDGLLELAKHFGDCKLKEEGPKFDGRKECLVQMEWTLRKEDGMCRHPVTEMAKLSSSISGWFIP